MERACLGSGGDNASGFLWPQRNYTCSFCKRQFNSAQALGGHMNVHRRDRAMLIQLPSWVFDQNPNPNFSSLPPSPLPPYHYTHHHHHHFLSSPPTSLISSSSDYKEKIKATQYEPSRPLDLSEDLSKKKNMTARVVDELEVLKKSELISLDLEIGCKDPKEVLDLELRLGCF